MWKIVVYVVENCRIYGRKLSPLHSLYCIVVVHVYSARIIARATIVTLRILNLRKTARAFLFQ